MKRIGIISSNLSSVGYDEDNRILEIEFNNGKIYQYSDVDKSVYNELLNAESIGRYFNKAIAKKYYYRKVS